MVGRHSQRSEGPARRQATFRFDDFELRAGRELRREGKPIAIGRIALDLLGALVDARGELVTKAELFDAAWPTVVVVENALHQHMRALRKALGDRADFIGTVARRGYRFLGEIEEVPVDAEPAFAFGEVNAIPSPLTPLIGREDELAAIDLLLQSHRCVSLLGPGGVGKTRLAQEIASTQEDRSAGRVGWCELAGLAEGESVHCALAEAFGLSGPASLAPLARIWHALGNTNALLVLDNCEHLIEACASAVHELLRHCPRLRVLATSQRPLSIAGEQRFLVSMLGLPPAGELASSVLATSPAVRLLLTRVSECDPSWRCDDDGLKDAAQLCRQLDGNALAIELAAMRVATLGLAATRAALADHFRLLAGVRRDGPPKHQSLDGMIDWSHGLLTAELQATFRRLAVFLGGWTIESARAVLGDASADAGGADLASRLADLVERSMITCESSAPRARFKMLEAQRLFAVERLHAGGERATYGAAHARHLCAFFEGSYAEWDDTADGAWIARYGPERDNLRAAIRFALEAPDAVLASRLVGSSIWLWRAIGAIHELRQVLEQVLLPSAAVLPGAVQARLMLAHAYSLHATSTESLHVQTAAERAVAAFTGAHDLLGEANARLCLASAYAQLGDTTAQRACLGQIDALLGERRQGKVYGWYCDSHAWAAQLAGDLREALHWAMKSRAAYRGSGAWHGETRAMLHIADLRLALGDVDDAIAIGEESAARLEGRHHRDDHGRALANLGAAWFARGDLEAARSCWELALDELRGLDFSYWVFDHIASLAIAEGREDSAAQMIGYANAGYARLRKGKRVQNEQRAHANAMAHLAARFDAAELATLLSVGAAAAEADVMALVLQRPGPAQGRNAVRAGGAGEFA